MLEQLLVVCFTVPLSALVTFLAVKRLIRSDKILDLTDEILNEATQNVEMQKKIYMLGVLIGNGIKQGVGLPAKGGKFKFEDLIGMAIQGFLGNVVPQQQQSQEIPISQRLR